LRPGDLIVAVDQEPVRGMNDLQRLLIGERIGAPVLFTIARAGTLERVQVTPVELDA
jgi:S1-C subfamily serine protease